MSNKNNDPNSFDSYKVIDSTDIKKNEKIIEAEAEKLSEIEGKQEVPVEEPVTSSPVPPPTYQAPTPQNTYQAPPQNTYQTPPIQNTYQNPPPYQPNYQQGTMKPEKRAGAISSVVFWVLLVVIGGFSLLVEFTAKGYIGAVITALMLAGLVFLKGKIIKKPIVHALIWVAATILFFVIIAVTLPKTGDTGGITVNTNTMVQSGGVEIERAGFASAVDPTTLKPTVETTVFKPDAPVVYYSILIKKMPAGTSLKAVITYGNQTVLNMDPTVFDEEIVDRYYTLSIPRATDKLMTEGQYTVTLIGTNGDKQVLKVSDTFTVAK